MLLMKPSMMDQNFLKINVTKAKLHERVSPTKSKTQKTDSSSPANKKNLSKIKSFEIQLDRLGERSNTGSTDEKKNLNNSDEEISPKGNFEKGKHNSMSIIISSNFQQDNVVEKETVAKPNIIQLKPSEMTSSNEQDDRFLGQREKEEVLDHVMDILESSALLKKRGSRQDIKSVLLSETSPMHNVTKRQSRQIAEWDGGYIYSEDFENRILNFLEKEGVEIVERAGRASLLGKPELTLGERKLSSILSKRNLLAQSVSPEKKEKSEELY